MPFKRKKKQQINVRLIVGEGPTEKAFCSYLRAHFGERNNNLQIEADSSRGGGAVGVLDRSRRKIRRGAYSQCLLLLDSDVARPDIPRKIKNVRIIEIIMEPCIEGMFLRILGIYRPSWKSDKCKKEFHKYLLEDAKYDSRNYEDIFPKKLLEKKRSEIEELDMLLKYYEI